MISENFKKIFHWILLISFLGLTSTSLAAEFFFSKEAIMQGLEKALIFKEQMSNPELSILPADQFFIARILRRDTWDIHFLFGMIFGISMILFNISQIKGPKNLDFFKLLLILSAYILFISGTYMYIRLYIDIGDEVFKNLKLIHTISMWVFIVSLILHIVNVIIKENKQKTNSLSRMIKIK